MIVDDLAREVGEIDIDEAIFERTRIGQRELVQIFDQCRQSLGFGEQRAEGRGIGLTHARLQGLQFEPQHGHGRAHRGEVGTPAATRFAVLLESTRKVIEVARERGDLVTSLHRDTRAEIAGGERARTLAQCLNRS